MWVSVGKKMTRAQIEGALKSVTYDDAVQHYKDLRKLFLEQLSLHAKKVGEESLEKELFEAIAEIKENPIENQKKLTEEMFKTFRDMVVDRLSNNVDVDQRAKNLYKNKEISKAKRDDELQALSQDLLSDDQLDLWIHSFLKDKYGGGAEGFSSSDFFTEFRAYSRRILSVSVGHRKNTGYKRRVNKVKGFTREALVYSAFLRAFEEESKENFVKMVGSERVKSEETGKNVQTAYDILISFTENLESALNTVVTATDDFQADEAIFGIQAKSYHYKQTEYDKSIGSRAELFKLANYTAQTNFWSWIDGIKFLERYADQVLGRYNVGYVTGDGFLFTSNFIRRMTQLHYYIAFVFDEKHRATQNVTWQQIQSD